MTQDCLKIPTDWGKDLVAYFNYVALYADPISDAACSRLARLLKVDPIRKTAINLYKKAIKNGTEPYAAADLLITAARLPDDWDSIQMEERGFPRRYKQSLSTSCNQISDAVQNKSLRYDTLFLRLEDDPFPTIDATTRKSLFLWMLSTIANADKASRIDFNKAFGSTPAPPIPRKRKSRTAHKVYLVQQLSHLSDELFGRSLHTFIARIATVVLETPGGVSPEQVRERWNDVLEKKAG